MPLPTSTLFKVITLSPEELRTSIAWPTVVPINRSSRCIGIGSRCINTIDLISEVDCGGGSGNIGRSGSSDGSSGLVEVIVGVIREVVIPVSDF